MNGLKFTPEHRRYIETWKGHPDYAKEVWRRGLIGIGNQGPKEWRKQVDLKSFEKECPDFAWVLRNDLVPLLPPPVVRNAATSVVILCEHIAEVTGVNSAPALRIVSEIIENDSDQRSPVKSPGSYRVIKYRMKAA